MNQRKGLLFCCLFAVTLLAYIPAIRGGFIWDDNDYVTENPTLLDASGLRDIWFDRSATPQYYPLVHSSFWVEYHLWGYHPTGYHIVNVLIHIVNALLLWRLLVRFSVPVAWFAAFVFAVHPVHVESVAWITERKNVLSGLFYLSAALCFLRYWDFTRTQDEEKPKSTLWYIASHVCFIGALLSKTVAATFPAALLVMIWWKRGRITVSNVISLVPMFVVGIAMGLVTVSLEKNHVGASGIDWELSAVERCLIAGRAIWFYAAKLIWPFELIFTYPRWTIDATQAWQFLFPMGVIAVLVALWLLRNRIGRGPLAAVCFFCGTLFPALGFFDVYPMRFSFVADHFQYFASIGVIVLVVATADAVFRRLNPESKTIPTVAAAVVSLVLVLLTMRQGVIYEDVETLWRDTLAKNPNSFMGHNNLGAILNDRGDFIEAEQHLRDSVRLKPNFVDSIVNLAKAREGQGDIDGAMALYQKATEVNPEFAPAHNGLGVALGMKGQHERAEASFREAMRLDPTYASPHANLATLFVTQEKHELAIENYHRAIEIDSKFTAASLNLARVLMSLQEFDRAKTVLESALSHDPTSVSALVNLGAVSANQKRYQAAIHHFERALELDPNHATANYNLSAMYDTIGDQTRATKYMNIYRRLTGQ